MKVFLFGISLLILVAAVAFSIAVYVAGEISGPGAVALLLGTAGAWILLTVALTGGRAR